MKSRYRARTLHGRFETECTGKWRLFYRYFKHILPATVLSAYAKWCVVSLVEYRVFVRARLNETGKKTFWLLLCVHYKNYSVHRQFKAVLRKSLSGNFRKYCVRVISSVYKWETNINTFHYTRMKSSWLAVSNVSLFETWLVWISLTVQLSWITCLTPKEISGSRVCHDHFRIQLFRHVFKAKSIRMCGPLTLT